MEAPRIKLCLLGQEFTLSIRRLNVIFEFQNIGEPCIPPTFYPQPAWNALASSSIYRPSSSKATKLKHPAAKYMHWSMTHSIFGRGESIGVVSKRELFVLWAMIHEGSIQINSRHWMLQHLLNVARHDTGAIVIGGLVSMIAMRLGVSLEDPVHTRVLGNDCLDLNTLVLMKLCHREGGKYVIINEASNYLPRPPVAVHEDIPVAANDASTSQPPPPPTHSAGPSQTEAPLSAILLQQLLEQMNSLTSEVREIRDSQRSMQFKLASIELQLQALNDTMNADTDEDGDGGES